MNGQEPTNAAELRALYKLDPEERAARYRLGEWLAAEPGRTWDHSDTFVVFLYDRPERADPVREVATGTGPTLAAAICDALNSPALASIANTEATLANNAQSKVTD